MNTFRHFSVRFLILVSAIAIIASPELHAQGQQQSNGNNGNNDNQPQQEQGLQGFWEIKMPGGKFVVPIAKIASVSEHTYVADGTRVYEVTVDTDGNQTARFYHLAPASTGGPLNITKNAIDRVTNLAQNATQKTNTEEVWSTVVKNYPATTHARTAEFRVSDPGLLAIIYNHVHRVWAEERGRGKANVLVISGN